MNDTQTAAKPASETKTAKKPGFFGRLLEKVDDSMKRKADEQSQQGSCCGGTDTKGNKCC